MAPQAYQPLSVDSEKGDSTYPLPAEDTRYLFKSAITSSGNFSISLSAVGAFFSGVLFTLFVFAIKSELSTMGQYETGFREERICKSDCCLVVHSRI